MGNDVLYAGGFPYVWKNDAQEIKASMQEDGWHPATIDFKATAEGPGSATAVSTLAEIIRYIEKKGENSISYLAIIGHANSRGFSLGGEIIPPAGSKPGNVAFNSSNHIDDSNLTANAEAIGKLKSKFASDAQIILVGCNAGLGADVLKSFAKAFGVCVRGFSKPVWTGLIVTTGSKPAVLMRGRVYYDTADLMPLKLAPGVAQWATSVTQLLPDSSAGCPPATKR